jgi:hypothetical protein
MKFLILLLATSVSLDAERKDVRAEVAVRLKLRTATIVPKEPIVVTYTIENQLHKPVLIQQDLSLGAVNVQVHSNRVQVDHYVSASDSVTSEPIVSADCRIRRDWTAIAPGHAYGETRTLPQLLTVAGKYQVVAEFELGNYSHEQFIEKCGFVVPKSQKSAAVTLTVLPLGKK